MTKPYTPKEYWQQRGKQYHGFTDNNSDIPMLCRLVGNLNAGDTICEIGSGYGRVYTELQNRCLLTITKFQMFDFVNSMREHCFEKTGRMPGLWDGLRIPINDNAYDLVISAYVLLHVPPADIRALFAEHVRVAKRFIYISSYTGISKGLSSHCFNHDYGKLIAENNLKVLDFQATGHDGIRANWTLEKTGFATGGK